MKKEEINMDSPGMQLFVLFLRRKKFIISFVAVCTIGAIVFSSPFFIPPKYKSVAIIYPPASSANKALLDDLRFGSDKDIDEHMQVLTSSIVRDSVITKYNLTEHYKIDTADPYKLHALYEKYGSNITIDRTRFNSISVTVYDTDPKLAAAVCNDIIEIADKVKEMIIQKNVTQAHNTGKAEMAFLKRQADTLVKIINESAGGLFKLSGVHNADYGSIQNEKIATREFEVRAVEKGEKTLDEKLFRYETLLNQMDIVQGSITIAERKMLIKPADSYVITPAEVADKKASPLRSVIILATILASFIFSLSTAFIGERLRNIRTAIQVKV